MIEELFLQTVPNKFSSRPIRLLVHCFHARMKVGSALSPSSAEQKKMHVIRHDDIAADRPAMAIMRVPPFVDQDTGNFV